MIFNYIFWFLSETFAGLVAISIYHFYYYALFWFFKNYYPKYLEVNTINYKAKLQEIFSDDRRYNFLILIIPSVAIFVRSTYFEIMELSFGRFSFTVAFLQATVTVFIAYLNFKKIREQFDRQ